MAKKYISMRNLKFMLHEVFDLSKINSLPKYQDYDAEAYDMTLAAAKDISDTYLFPIFREMDKKKAYYDEETGTVKVHPGLPKFKYILFFLLIFSDHVGGLSLHGLLFSLCNK